ncbi:MAG: hypothetical protein KAT34_13260 [Candidatus Aminicenantes bacterium]|nr:hypothetical protein [Candidatus Aminicenantes bacterium]
MLEKIKLLGLLIICVSFTYAGTSKWKLQKLKGKVKVLGVDCYDAVKKGGKWLPDKISRNLNFKMVFAADGQ